MRSCDARRADSPYDLRKVRLDDKVPITAGRSVSGAVRRHGLATPLWVRGFLLGLVALEGVVNNLPPVWAQEEIFVANRDANSVTVYARTANGNVAPMRTLSGAATGLNQPLGLVVDTVNGELLVANFGGKSITVYTRGAGGNTP